MTGLDAGNLIWSQSRPELFKTTEDGEIEVRILVGGAGFNYHGCLSRFANSFTDVLSGHSEKYFTCTLKHVSHYGETHAHTLVMLTLMGCTEIFTLRRPLALHSGYNPKYRAQNILDKDRGGCYECATASYYPYPHLRGGERGKPFKMNYSQNIQPGIQPQPPRQQQTSLDESDIRVSITSRPPFHPRATITHA
uniref:Uncharacterized protein n=1 Tax=Timema bartmani TaxID=61472 RepID=A0A7R9ETU6_9NEOP|nr:unnamed protein product [Timema bartmani]